MRFREPKSQRVRELESQRVRSWIFLIFSAYFSISAFCFPARAENIKLKMTVANTSDTETKTMPVKTYLPSGVNEEDILDKGNFKIAYDFEKSLYYVYQELALKPAETATLEITMRDIWVIPEDDIAALKEHAQNILSALKKTDYYGQAKTMTDSVCARLDKISRGQALTGDSAEQKISGYGANNAIMKDVKKDIGILEDMITDEGGSTALAAAGLMGESASPDHSVRVENMGRLDPEKLGTIKFKIEVANAAAEAKDVPVKYYLPVEIGPEYIVSSGGLDLAYDYQKSQSYVYKEAVPLGPQENKEFVIEVKDVWVILVSQIQLLRQHTENLAQSLSETAYKEPAQSLADNVALALEEIEKGQADKEISVETHIGRYRANLLRFDEARKNTAKLEQLVKLSGGTPESGAISGKKESGAGAQGVLAGARRIKSAGKSIFRGKAPDASTSWKIIWIIVGFLAVVSSLFFMLWWTQIKAGEGKRREDVNRKEK